MVNKKSADHTSIHTNVLTLSSRSFGGAFSGSTVFIELVFLRNSITCHTRWITLHGHRVELCPILTQSWVSINSGFLAARRYRAILAG
jgi:hypothetical protein